MKATTPLTSVGKRIAAARNSAKLTQQELANRLSLAQGTIAGWELNKNEPSFHMIEKIALLTKTDPSWVAFGRAQTSAIVNDQRYVSVGVYDIHAAAGDGAIADHERTVSHKLFELELIRGLTRSSPDRLAVIRVRGDSMQETLFNGDHVLVDLDQRHVAREGVYVINVEQSLQVKRISMHPKTKLLTVKSDNPRYPTYDDLTVEDLSVVGRVIWLGRSLG